MAGPETGPPDSPAARKTDTAVIGYFLLISNVAKVLEPDA